MHFTPGLRGILLVLWMVGCGASNTIEPSPDNSPVPNQITLTPAVLNVVLGTTRQLTAVVLDSAGVVIPTALVTYSSGDTTVAKISATGLVTAVGIGTGTITVRSDPATATTVVTVENPALLSLGEDTVVALNVPTQLPTVVFDDVGDSIPGVTVTYRSRRADLVSVTTAGLATANSVGTSWIVGEVGTLRDSVRVTGVIARLAVPGQLFGAAVSASGTAYITDVSGAIARRVNLTTPGLIGGVIVGSGPSSVALLPDGSRAFVGNQSDGTVSIVDVASSTVVATPAFSEAVLAVTVAPGDTLLFVGTESRIYWLRLADLTLTDSVTLPDYTNALAIRDTLLYASVPRSGVVEEINILTGSITRALAVGGTPQGLALAASGSQLYIANETGWLQLWDLTANTLSGSVALVGGGGFGVGVNPVNGLLYVSTSYYGSRVHVIDPITRTVAREIYTGGVPRRIVFSPSGDVGIVTNEGGWVDYIR